MRILLIYNRIVIQVILGYQIVVEQLLYLITTHLLLINQLLHSILISFYKIPYFVLDLNRKVDLEA